MNSYIYPGLKKFKKNQISITGDMIINTVCEYYDLNKAAIMEKSRKRELVAARRMIYFLMREKTQLTKTRIGQYFNLDHTTIIHGINSFNDLRSIYPELTADMVMIKDRLEG